MFCKKVIATIYSFILFTRVMMSWNIGDKRNLFLNLKTKLELYHVELRSKPIDSPKKITLTLVETQQLLDIEKTDSKDEIFCLKSDTLQW